MGTLLPSAPPSSLPSPVLTLTPQWSWLPLLCSLFTKGRRHGQTGMRWEAEKGWIWEDETS